MPARLAVTRRRTLYFLGAGASTLLAGPALASAATASAVPMEVWKDPNCGCCQDWIAHMQANGFHARIHNSGNQAMRSKLGLPPELGSCHTAWVAGYVIEGHVPAADVHQLLRQQPKALGLSVPGMPIGSPGMDGPAYGGRRDPYDVLLLTQALFGRGVSTRVFTSYR